MTTVGEPKLPGADAERVSVVTSSLVREARLRVFSTTMNTQHTPGPWHAVYSSLHERTAITTFDKLDAFPNSIIAIVNETMHELDGETSKTDRANARLIAAAPELLEALQGLVNLCECDQVFAKRSPMVQARAALASATGKE